MIPAIGMTSKASLSVLTILRENSSTGTSPSSVVVSCVGSSAYSVTPSAMNLVKNFTRGFLDPL